MSFQFSPEEFLRDTKATAEAIGAAYSEEATRKVLDTYADSLRDGAVLWRATDRPGDALNYRFYERIPTNSVTTAIRAGLLDPKNPMIDLISAWSSLYSGTSTELCDFDAEHGLSKTWIYLGGMRPLEQILGVPGVPRVLRAHESRFRELGLTSVRHVAVDYRSSTASLYFRTSRKITWTELEQLLTLVGGELPTPELFSHMEKFTSPDGFTFSVTAAAGGAEIQQVGVYALRLPVGQFPVVGDRLATFFDSAPSYDDEEMNAPAWSFGPGGKNYVKAERSYCGRLVELMKQWNSPMTTVY
ncbi:aromatic prenyltransferase [Lentzea jiangxiensis]|uniref:4-hydroxyphenylpyruvate 3-dimethylallyltransferase n=1 Tax=Lentzea jiangxiensis TaxID=641025 RepID=A0A1H0X3G0_9PSEU|nr:aromatic prenyltransferase [Lentzea jiangxiensis]SDP97420.1 4-hydroxyphenylpyruvate 3-dimethylallyltransferase [Lentzea jiangxiensis]